MQVAVMGHCLNALLPAEDRSVENRVRAAARLGVTHVEPYGGTWPADVDMRTTAEVVRREGDREGVLFPVFGSNERLGQMGDRADGSMAALKREVEACQIIGASVLTCAIIDAQPVAPGGEFGLPFERSVQGLVEALGELAAYGEERRVRIGVLTHGALVYLGWHQEWLVRLAGQAAAGSTVDPGNYLYYGHETPEIACGRLAGQAVMFRAGDWRPRTEEAVKADFARDGRLSVWESVPLGTGVVDHLGCLRLLKKAGYDGVVSLKSPGPPIPDAATALSTAVKKLREWVREA